MKKGLSLAVTFAMLLFGTAITAKPEPATMARCERIHEAARALEGAMHDLESAGHDFCHHKEEAMEATRHALEQLRRAEECDRCRGDHDHD